MAATRRGRHAVLLIAILVVCCAPVPEPATVLELRQRTSAGIMEVTVGETQLSIVVLQRGRIVEQGHVEISPGDAARVRALFWSAFRRQPTGDLHPVQDLTFEQEWQGRARSQRVQIQGYPLSRQDREAYEFINDMLPERYRFLIDAGLYGRSH
jgi:hypothetical protein